MAASLEDPASVPLASAAVWLRRGHALEAAARFAAAIAAYDRSRAFAHDPSVAETEAGRRARALAAMNRGNALQRCETSGSIAAAVRAYDEAIALFGQLPHDRDPFVRNRLGAAWMNRGRALQLSRDPSRLAAAAASHERALACLGTLPIDAAPVFRRNLAGAWLNLADALLDPLAPGDGRRAHSAARNALELVAARAGEDLEFADLALKSRRALVDAIGRLLVSPDFDPAAVESLADEAADAVDSGLALARLWETRGVVALRPLALRLFRFGAQLYWRHQPQFFAEFLLETIAPAAADRAPFASDPEFRAAARAALDQARAELNRPRLFFVGDSASEGLVHLSRELAAVERVLAQPAG